MEVNEEFANRTIPQPKCFKHLDRLLLWFYFPEYQTFSVYIVDHDGTFLQAALNSGSNKKSKKGEKKSPALFCSKFY